jgi:glycosyltransferase involved in cell wall biosynthesis
VNIVLGAYLLSGTPGYRQAGVHYYARNLIAALANTDVSSNVTALVGPTAIDEARCAAGRIRVRIASRTTERPLSRIYVEQVETPRVLRSLNADLYHGLGFVAPVRAPCPIVVSVMDLSFVTRPGAHKRVNRIYLTQLTRVACRRAARVIAISESTGRDVVAHCGVAPERVDVTPLGVDHTRFRPLPAGEVAAFRAERGIGDRAIFYLGSLEPRKNLTRLIDAFSILHADVPVSNAQLFIGGSLAWKYDEVVARIQQLGLAERVKLVGRVSDDDLPRWYSACAVMAYPSLYEGFGLPPLEAMACGAPVVTSNVTSLPEVVGDAGMLVEPTDTHALTATLKRVLTSDALRAEMRAKSLARAAQFTWARTAELTMQSYRSALARPR